MIGFAPKLAPKKNHCYLVGKSVDFQGFSTSGACISELRQYFWSRFVLIHISYAQTNDSARFQASGVLDEKSVRGRAHRPPPQSHSQITILRYGRKLYHPQSHSQ